MELNLIVVNGQHSGSVASNMSVGVDVFSIGRGVDNSWVLPDPELHISNKHCVIHRKNNEFHLTDISTNGVFFNGSDKPIGRGSSIVLKQGDLFSIGNFEIRAELSDVGSTETVGQSFDELLAVDAFAGEAPDFAKIIAQDTDVSDDSIVSASPSRNYRAAPVVQPEKEFFRVPSVVPGVRENIEEAIGSLQDSASGVIPDNWLDQLGGAETPHKVASSHPSQVPDGRGILNSCRNENAGIETEPLEVSQSSASEDSSFEIQVEPQVKQSAAEPAYSQKAEVKGDFELFLEAAGIPAALLQSDKSTDVIARDLGELLRLLVQGIVEVLATRSLVKSEFRLQQTMIRPAENNPFKFAPTGIEALKIMMMSGSSAYLPASTAAEEGFRDIQSHQLAMMSGIQSAFEKLLSRFDPEQLEKEFTHRPKYTNKKILGRQKIDFWSEYKDFYEETLSLMKDDFQSLFANEFGKAYEDRLRQLK